MLHCLAPGVVEVHLVAVRQAVSPRNEQLGQIGTLGAGVVEQRVVEIEEDGRRCHRRRAV